jgi:hypothetical protein
MAHWIAASDSFIEADIIRWTEGVFGKRRGKSAKAPFLGKRQVTAEILRIEPDGWVHLLVRSVSEEPSEFAGTTMPKLEPQTAIKRARKTIHRGKPERLQWSDEEARASVAQEP